MAEPATERLRLLYRDIHACEKCFADPECQMQPDDQRVVSRVVPRAITSRVFLLGQALGPETQRRSGLPYTHTNGALSRTGRALDQFLRRIGFTIDVTSPLPYAYSSDIVQRYPGRMANGRGDRRPTPREIANCIEWLVRELEIVRPRIILLLGLQPARHFLRAFGPSQTIHWGAAFDVERAGSPATAFVVYHPGYRRRKPNLVDLLYQDVAARARRLLDDHVAPPS